MAGPHAGKWRDWANDVERGDLIDLWQSVKGLSRIQTLREVKDFLGIHEDVRPQQKKHYSPASPEREHRAEDQENQDKILKYLSMERKIEPAIVNRFQIWSDGYSIVYPYYSPEGELLNRCYIGLQRSNGKKVIRMEKGCAPSLWGWQALDDKAYKDRKILICEGLLDCATWTQWGIPSLSASAGSNLAWIDYEWENLEMFSEIFISFDEDSAGRETLKKAINRLGLHRCRIVHLPYKDANECLLQGWTKDDAEQAVLSAEYPKYSGLSPANDYRTETIEEFYPNPNKPNGVRPELFQRFDGGLEFLPGDVTVWTGHCGDGKSTLLTFLMSMMIVSHGQKAMIASLEMKPQRILSRALKAIMKKPDLSKDEINQCLDDMGDRLLFTDKIGYIERKELLDTMLFAYSRHGAEQFVIDSFMRISGLEEDYPAQGEFLGKLQDFAKQSGAHIHLVCHPRKTVDEHIPTKHDVKGSSLIANNCDNLVVLYKNKAKEKIRRERKLTEDEETMMFDTEIVSEKSRESGWMGRVLLRFDPRTFIFSKF